MNRESSRWMWAEACDMLARAERMHRQLFQPAAFARVPVWEPPVDIIETAGQVIVLVALPGVDPEGVETLIDNGHLLISAVRVLPTALRSAVIHRMELPQGRFERRIPLPAGCFSGVTRTSRDGCLVVTLDKGRAPHG